MLTLDQEFKPPQTPDQKPSFGQETQRELPPELQQIAELMHSTAQTEADRKIATRARGVLENFFERARNANNQDKVKTDWVHPQSVDGQKVYPIPVAFTDAGHVAIDGGTNPVFFEEYQQRLCAELGVFKYLNIPPNTSVGNALKELYVRQHNQAEGDRAFENGKWINYSSSQAHGMGARGVIQVHFVGNPNNVETQYPNKYNLAGVEFSGMSPMVDFKNGRNGVDDNADYLWTDNTGAFTRKNSGRSLTLLLPSETVDKWFGTRAN